eukprot:2618643-Pyramimonas_sp.AAC.1
MLFVFWSSNVYVYDIDHPPNLSGEPSKTVEECKTISPKWIYKNLHEQPISAVCMVKVPSNSKGGNLVITGSSDTKVKVRVRTGISRRTNGV